MTKWYVYLIQCEHDYLYCGSTNDLTRRYRQHCLGQGARFTRTNKPIALYASAEFANRSAACQFEAALKKWPKHKKIQWAEAHRVTD